MVLPKFEKWHGNKLINEVVLGGRSFFFFVFMLEQNSSTVLGLFKKKSFFLSVSEKNILCQLPK
jgi:hypothetical protein